MPEMADYVEADEKSDHATHSPQRQGDAEDEVDVENRHDLTADGKPAELRQMKEIAMIDDVDVLDL
jgi:hypothetical protein